MRRIPKYPIYILSKGRWDTPLTMNALTAIGHPYFVAVEQHEVEKYRRVIKPPAQVLELPFSNLGQGSIPARNWIWDHAAAAGVFRYWILDDNIRNFYRLVDNKRYWVRTPAIFRAAEDLVDRYENVPMAGFNYSMFADERSDIPPFYLNTRVYSCILLRTDAPYRWRGRYNEDTDLSLRVLKDENCTILFNAFLCNKVATLKMKGGNTEDLYKLTGGDVSFGRLRMAESLQKQHPEHVTITKKWGRAQHLVDYTPFAKNKLQLKAGVVVPKGEDEYGMVLRQG